MEAFEPMSIACAPPPCAAPCRPVARYLAGVMNDFAAPAAPRARAVQPWPASAGQVLAIMGERRFTHLSRTQAEAYRAMVLPRLQADLDAGRPLRFCWDLGPGYHASLRADFRGLRFAPGLGELLALRQVRRFAQAVQALHAPGVHFDLVIDDLCAWVANDVEPGLTAGYLERLDALVRAVGLQGQVSVLAESALESADAYRRAFEREPARPWPEVLGPAERDNVSRFVGRACSGAAARAHIERYERAQAVSGRLMAQHLQGVRLTQRASAQCWGFRSFPGGAGRLQCGEVDLVLVDGAHPRPQLITSSHGGRVHRWPVAAQDLPPGWPLPQGVAHAAVFTAPPAGRVAAAERDGTRSGCE